MKIIEFGKYKILKGSFDIEPKYREPLSKMIIERFGEGPFDEIITKDILVYSYNFFIAEFRKLCHAELSIRFYQFVLMQHEQSIEVAFFYPAEKLPEEIDMEYIAIYRRVLKMILEEACSIPLTTPKKYLDADFERSKERLDELVFLGRMAFMCAQLIAEQSMIEDLADVSFDHNKLYVFSHKHHYNEMIKQIMESYGVHYFKHVVDEQAVNDLYQAIKNCFSLESDHIRHLIASIHKELEPKGGQYCGFGWDTLVLNMVNVFGSRKEDVELFFRGLTLDRNNRMTLENLVIRPQNINRYLYRPILIWNVDGNDYAFLGANAYTESIFQLTTNSIPWGKASDEWLRNVCFQQYANSKSDEHDKWLDDMLEKKLNEAGIINFRNVTQLTTDNGNISLLNNGVGEIDSIAIVETTQKVYVIDCKHLQSKYDIISQKNDYSNFVKSYDPQIKRKTDWINNHRQQLSEHLKRFTGGQIVDLTGFSVEGIFVINTPTFYMFNSVYRIYTIDLVARILLGELVDPEFSIIIQGENSMTNMIVGYPYFKKPVYKYLTDLDESATEPHPKDSV